MAAASSGAVVGTMAMVGGLGYEGDCCLGGCGGNHG